MKRRTFVFYTLAATALIAVPFAALRRYSDSFVRTIGEPAFLSNVCDDKTIRAIGTVYCARNPEEAKPDKLMPLLLGTIGESPDRSYTKADYDRLTQKLDAAVRDDYADGKVTNVNGWVLSLTEARQCALYSLR